MWREPRRVAATRAAAGLSAVRACVPVSHPFSSPYLFPPSLHPLPILICMRLPLLCPPPIPATPRLPLPDGALLPAFPALPHQYERTALA